MSLLPFRELLLILRVNRRNPVVAARPYSYLLAVTVSSRNVLHGVVCFALLAQFSLLSPSFASLPPCPSRRYETVRDCLSKARAIPSNGASNSVTGLFIFRHRNAINRGRWMIDALPRLIRSR